jgi:L,D-peptidoglycan transpeptidase YkuD (ErfK/YbiS/YcfS/YnhG family)
MSPSIYVNPEGTLLFNGHEYRCSLGEKGVTGDKREGDLKTPVGSFALMECWYRADRMKAPKTSLPLRVIQKDDGWCDDVKSPQYNQHVKLPFAASHEELWREDEKYDLIVTLNYNVKPLIPGKGSAIFFHVAPEGYPPTQGCVGLLKADLLEVLERCALGTLLCVRSSMPEAVGY